MKKIILLIALVSPLAFVEFPVYAHPDPAISNERLLQDGKVKIKKEELPQSAKNTLSGDTYKGWSVVGVFKTKEGDYEVELKKGDTTQALRFDKEGKVKG